MKAGKKPWLSRDAPPPPWSAPPVPPSSPPGSAWPYSGAASAATAPPQAVTSCAAVPSSCGYPDATNTGVPAGMALKTVPGQVSSGTGWHFDSRGWVQVDGAGAVLSGLNIPYNINVTAPNVTIKDVQVTTSGQPGISLRHTAGATVEDSTITGVNATTGRMLAGVKDMYGDSTGLAKSCATTSPGTRPACNSNPGWSPTTTSTTPASSPVTTSTGSPPTAASPRC